MWVSSHISYLHHLVLLAARQSVHLLDRGLGDLLQPPRAALRIVLRHLALLLHVFHAMQLVAADVANRDARLLRLLTHQLHVFAAALFSEWRDGDPDHLAVARRVETLFAGAQRLLDRAHLALVVDLHDEETRLWGADLRELVERGRRPVVRHHDLVDQRRVRTSRPDGCQLRCEVVDRLRHLRLRIAEYRVDHDAEPTTVPTSSPSTTRSMLPGVNRLKTTMGTSLSMQSVSAVLSMTSIPRFKTSRYPRRSNL